MYLWRPSDSSKRFAYSHLASDDDEDEDEDEEEGDEARLRTGVAELLDLAVFGEPVEHAHVMFESEGDEVTDRPSIKPEDVTAEKRSMPKNATSRLDAVPDAIVQSKPVGTARFEIHDDEGEDEFTLLTKEIASKTT